MKITSTLLLTIADASHFRAIGMEVAQGLSGQIRISRSHAWRRASAGYPVPGCTSADVKNQTPSTPLGAETCQLHTGESCGVSQATYIVTDVESMLGDANDYCYGYRQEAILMPSGPFTISWGSCCWVDLTTDDGEQISGGSYGFRTAVYDVTNNSPQVKLPPIWKIMAGCPAQTLDLSPVDMDDDVIQCRFGDETEALGAFRGSNFNSITIDKDTCILTYDGTVDTAMDGVKPISVMVEDFDEFGNIRSSIPVQFLASVWTPTNSNFIHRQLALHGPGNPFIYKPFFHLDDHDITHADRRRRADVNDVPSYCFSKPILMSPSPPAGSTITVSYEGVIITLKASSTNGAITRFQYNSPIGMVCTPVNNDGEVSCAFTPNAAQQGLVHNFCFNADDAAGLSTERRCVSLNAVMARKPVTEIFSLLEHVFKLEDITIHEGWFANYGCAGVGNLHVGQPTRGQPVDDIDRALNKRKHCINCAVAERTATYNAYNYDEIANVCGKIYLDLLRVLFGEHPAIIC